eukprot:CAMPEP_0117668312 /NCGR_PEP_ID=MMETSP0804-20121206/11474_1 /TAXON_ID=1074897 /ORGANISM="Tetraselmis astigmatica, Strain CCMP880" /LENGTH=276 /DNA_ID=CAMNT_0005476179 /DNA_START=95 /DNA_END=925 /DNA_ORIENTATION=+
MDGGASQFTGGGFMPSQAGGDPGSAQKKPAGGQATLRAVTVKQLHEASSQAVDDQYMLDGEELTNITILGRIVHTEENATCLSFKINDGTGVVDVRYWNDRDESELLQQNKAQWCMNAYVRIHGGLRSFGNDKHLMAFNIRAVTDFNEVTYHQLQVIFQHEHIIRGGRPSGNTGGAQAPVKPEPAAAAGAYGGMGAGADLNEIGNDGLNHAQRMVKAIFDAPECAQSEAGLHIQEAIRRLAGKMSEAEVREAVDFLTAECHIYTTTDDCHYKSTSC